MDQGQKNKETRFNQAMDVLDGLVHKVQARTTVANLPTASDNTNALAIATDVDVGDETWLVFSNGTNWIKIVQVDGAVAAA